MRVNSGMSARPLKMSIKQQVERAGKRLKKEFFGLTLLVVTPRGNVLRARDVFNIILQASTEEEAIKQLSEYAEEIDKNRNASRVPWLRVKLAEQIARLCNGDALKKFGRNYVAAKSRGGISLYYSTPGGMLLRAVEVIRAIHRSKTIQEAIEKLEKIAQIVDDIRGLGVIGAEMAKEGARQIEMLLMPTSDKD
jgi:hypothetical protein